MKNTTILEIETTGNKIEVTLFLREKNREEPKKEIQIPQTKAKESTKKNYIIRELLTIAYKQIVNPKPKNTKVYITLVDSAEGVNVERHIVCASSTDYVVYDMSGVGEVSSSNNPHKEVVESIRNYFSKKRTPLNFICYVMKQGRSKLAEIQNTFLTFKKIFKGGENYDTQQPILSKVQRRSVTK